MTEPTASTSAETTFDASGVASSAQAFAVTRLHVGELPFGGCATGQCSSLRNAPSA
jgi:hypothetical protein